MRSLHAARVLGAFACMLGCACGAGSEAGAPEKVARSTSAITHGSADTGDDAVVAIVTASGVMACTGTVVGPHLVLTAAHCVAPSIIDGASVVVGASVASPSATLPVARAVAHPQFDPVALTDDVAVLVLASATSVTPVPLGSSAPGSGSDVDLVGWGITGQDAGDSGEKRQGTGVVTQVAASTFAVGAVPSQPCEGDSGGPAFVTANGVTSVEGVTSHGDAACVAGATYMRVDAYLASFLAPTIAAYAEGSATPGSTCLYPEQCAGGAAECVVAPDDASVRYCSAACRENTDCPSSMICVTVGDGSQCRYPLPTPGTYGASCGSNADCAEGECTTTGLCALRCVPDAPVCPAGSTCENTSAIDFFCVAPPARVTGGCTVIDRGGRASVPGSLGVVVVALLVARRRARRR